MRRDEEEDKGGMIIAHINGNINIYAGNSQCCDLINGLMANLNKSAAFPNVAYNNLHRIREAYITTSMKYQYEGFSRLCKLQRTAVLQGLI